MSQTRTPGSIIGASVIMFIYGALLLMCGVCGGGALALQPQNDALGLQAAMQKEAPGFIIIGIATPVFQILIGFLFIGSGIGILRLMNGFRFTAYLACAAILLTMIANGIYTAVFIIPVQQRVMMQQFQNPNNPPMPANMNMIMTGSIAFGLLIGIAIHFAFCLPIVVLVSMKSARDAFAGVLPEGDDDPYLIRRRPPRDDDDDDDETESPRTRRSRDDTGITDRGQ